MTDLPEDIRKAIDLAVNHHLIEEDEIFPGEDGQMMFERSLREYAQAGGSLEELLPLIPSFTTTSWKTAHPEASQNRVTWPWKMNLVG